MNKDNLTRRDFQRLATAALSGILLGTSLHADEASGADEREKSLTEEPHVCRGLNTCKEMGQTKDNACAGQGMCANVSKHDCAGKNGCRGQGGCGSFPGENNCSGMGKGRVPLSDKAWKKARKHFEEQMTKAGKKYGPAPKKPGS